MVRLVTSDYRPPARNVPRFPDILLRARVVDVGPSLVDSGRTSLVTAELRSVIRLPRLPAMPHREILGPSIFCVRSFLQPEECAAWIQLAEQAGFDAAPIDTAAGPQQRPEVRNNRRVLYDNAAAAERLWQRARPFVTEHREVWQPIGLNERLRFYRYDVGQQFAWHYDGCHERANGERSWLTFMIYLNDGYGGGQTAFTDLAVEPVAGTALFFEHEVRHQGRPVTHGCKYVLRSDVMYRHRSA